jgi:hypothetical protein
MRVLKIADSKITEVREPAHTCGYEFDIDRKEYS